MTDLSTYWKNYDPETGVGDPSTPLAAQTLNEFGAELEQVRADAENFRNQAWEAAEQAQAPTDGQMAAAIANPASATRAALDGRYGTGVRSVTHFGATGDGVTDDLPAFQAAYADAVAAGGGSIHVPAGTYRLTGEWDLWRPNAPRVDIAVHGDDQLTTILVADFYGADKALIRCTDPDKTTRSSPLSLRNLGFRNANTDGPNPVFVWVDGIGESRLEGLRFSSSNNTHMRLGSLQNTRLRDIVSFYGGRHFLYRDTTGITFTSSAGSDSLTASAPIFNALDPGRTISLHAGSNRAQYRISNYISPTEVRINPLTPAVSMSGAAGFFEPARITTTAGSDQVSANAQVFTPDDVGRVLYIRGAKAGPYGPALLRGTITEVVSAATVKLDVTADVSVTRTEFTAPVIDLYTPAVAGTLGAGSNDVKIELLHIENYAGVGLVVQNSIFMHLNDMKIHGEQTPVASWSSQASMWLDDYSGIISGELDGANLGPARIYLCNMNDLLTVDWVASRMVTNGKIFEADTFTDPGGVVEVRTLNLYRATPGADPHEAVTDPNTIPRVTFAGLVNMLGDTEPPRIYLGRDTYITPTGSIVTKSPNGTRYRIVVANGGALSTTPA